MILKWKNRDGKYYAFTELNTYIVHNYKNCVELEVKRKVYRNKKLTGVTYNYKCRDFYEARIVADMLEQGDTHTQKERGCDS